MIKPIKIKLAKIWKPYPTVQNIFKGMPFMYKHFNFVDSSNPEYVLFSVYKYGGNLPTGKYVKILYNPEKYPFNMDDCDWAFSCNYDEEFQHPRHMRLPLYKFLGAGNNLIKGKIDSEKILQQKTKFCAFIYSNSVEFRNKFFKKLSKYKHVDSPGRVLNNMPPIGSKKYKNALASRMSIDWPTEKVHFLKPYKFTIAFENAAVPGYTCEKSYHPMLAMSIPINYGNPLMHRDFNMKSMITIKSEKDFERAIDEIVQLDRNDDLYIKKLQESWYPNNKLTEYVKNERYIDRFKLIFEMK